MTGDGSTTSGADIIAFLLGSPGGLPGFLDWIDAEHSTDASGRCSGCGADGGPAVPMTACPVRPWVDLALWERAR